MSISNASNLGFLDLNANKLSGKIPSLEKLNRMSLPLTILEMEGQMA